jgi:tRNA(Ile)-lysidine synthase
MGPIPHVLHGSARPIAIREFLEALEATCRPRFPRGRGDQHRRVGEYLTLMPVLYQRLTAIAGIAVSGGVDSMALAFLCSKARRFDPWMRIADHPVNDFVCFIIDHQLREGSAQEAEAVCRRVRGMGHSAQVYKLRWHFSDGDIDPNNLPHVETLARRLRYRALARCLGNRSLVSLLLAHHEDDQYETVLMRLMSGHSLRGLRGMRPVQTIPECYDLHGLHKSGFVDDQKLERPMYNMGPTRRQKKVIRQALRADIDMAVLAQELNMEISPEDLGFRGYDDSHQSDNQSLKWPMPRTPQLDIESGGVTMFRPLLEFSKERLIATCLENNIPWFEDSTNSDPGLTERNAIRYLYKQHKLPVALQKPAILQLAATSRKQTAAEDAEAARFLGRGIIHDFDNTASTLLVTLPDLQVRPRRLRSRYRRLWEQERAARRRTIAALLIRQLVDFVTPEEHLPPISELQTTVAAMFPSLIEENDATEREVPKAFTKSQVYFIPIRTDSNGRSSWYLSRAPYSSKQPLPELMYYGISRRPVMHRDRSSWPWPSWTRFSLYDGRFWIRTKCRLPCAVVVLPFFPEYAKSFREGVEDKQELGALLKRHAPAKVRYTLPAIYALRNIDWLLKGENEKGSLEDETGPRGSPEFRRWPSMTNDDKRVGLQLLALPTLGVHLPGIVDWMKWEVRYRNVNSEALGQDGWSSFKRSPAGRSRSLSRRLQG